MVTRPRTKYTRMLVQFCFNVWPSLHAGAWNGTAAPIDGVYVEHAANVSVDGLSVTFVGAPKPSFTL